MMKNFILADGRWSGPHGIGRFSKEILSRLHNTDILIQGPKPLSMQNLFWLPYQLALKKNYKLYFSPGFNPPAWSPMPYVFTICDLIHLKYPGNAQLAKQIYYNSYIKPRVRKAYKIITISEYSKNVITEWAGVDSNHVINVGCGIHSELSPEGKKHQPGYPYLLHVGNMKPHKNVPGLIEAFALAKISSDVRLILTGTPSPEVLEKISNYKMEGRVVMSGILNEEQLAEYYRGAVALVFPSFCEGFGLPPVEAMACGTPVVVSNTTSLPEVVGDAALLVDPHDAESIADGIEKIVSNTQLRNGLIVHGLNQAKLFSWDAAAKKVQDILSVAI